MTESERTRLAKVPKDRDLERLTFVTDIRDIPMYKHMNAMILCQGCKGIIIFDKDEILEHKRTGRATSTPCQDCGWHPGFPPEPWLEYDGKLELEQ